MGATTAQHRPRLYPRAATVLDAFCHVDKRHGIFRAVLCQSSFFDLGPVTTAVLRGQMVVGRDAVAIYHPQLTGALFVSGVVILNATTRTNQFCQSRVAQTRQLGVAPPRPPGAPTLASVRRFHPAQSPIPKLIPFQVLQVRSLCTDQAAAATKTQVPPPVLPPEAGPGPGERILVALGPSIAAAAACFGVVVAYFAYELDKEKLALDTKKHEDLLDIEKHKLELEQERKKTEDDKQNLEVAKFEASKTLPPRRY